MGNCTLRLMWGDIVLFYHKMQNQHYKMIHQNHVRLRIIRRKIFTFLLPRHQNSENKKKYYVTHTCPVIFPLRYHATSRLVTEFNYAQKFLHPLGHNCAYATHHPYPFKKQEKPTTKVVHEKTERHWNPSISRRENSRYASFWPF